MSRRKSRCHTSRDVWRRILQSAPSTAYFSSGDTSWTLPPPRLPSFRVHLLEICFYQIVCIGFVPLGGTSTAAIVPRFVWYVSPRHNAFCSNECYVPSDQMAIWLHAADHITMALVTRFATICTCALSAKYAYVQSTTIGVQVPPGRPHATVRQQLHQADRHRRTRGSSSACHGTSFR